MNWKNNPFFHVEDSGKENEASKDQPQQSEQGGSGKTAFTRRLPSLESAEIQVTTNTYTSRPSAEDQEKYNTHFDGILQNANIPPPNYFTFARMLAEMGELPDTPKFKSAFAALKVQGLTKATLISTANTYLGVLDEDNKGFKKAVEDQQKGNTQNIQLINDTIKSNNSEIERIQAETAEAIKRLEEQRDSQIQQLKSNNDQSLQQIAPLEESSKKVDHKLSAYDSACNQYKRVIQDDISKIQSIIN